MSKNDHDYMPDDNLFEVLVYPCCADGKAEQSQALTKLCGLSVWWLNSERDGNKHVSLNIERIKWATTIASDLEHVAQNSQIGAVCK